MRIAIILASFQLLVGCSSAALIYLNDGSVAEGRIIRSSSTHIYTQSGQSFFIENVVSIDHPGNVLATIGTIGLVLTLPPSIVFGLEYSGCKEEEKDCLADVVIFTGSLLYAITSTVIGILGWTTWATSKLAAEPQDDDSGPRVVPITVYDGDKSQLGLGLSWSW